jgi:hypothetical protein
MLVLAILVAAGIVWRRPPETHKRLMLLATIGLPGAAISKWPIAIVRARPAGLFLVTDLLVLAAAGHDLASRRQVHPAHGVACFCWFRSRSGWQSPLPTRGSPARGGSSSLRAEAGPTCG